jgi:hypothetical protein
VHQQRLPGHRPERLGSTRPEPDTETGRDNEDRDVTARILLRGHVAVL